MNTENSTSRYILGQQQILFIVLGLILVGAAIFTGISIFSSSADVTGKDAAITDLNNLADIARTHYQKRSELGGGGESFANFQIPESFLNSLSGTTIEHVKVNHKPDHLHFEANGDMVGEDGEPVYLEARVTFHDMIIREIKVKRKKRRSWKRPNWSRRP